MQNIRNFVIIAHIDHGKSTLADRFLEITKTIEKRHMKAQYLDQLELERERGITIKMAPVRMHWKPSRGLTQIEADSRGLLYEDLTYKIRGVLFRIYNSLGPGHKENVYQNSLALELTKEGLSFEKEKRIDVIYDGKKVGLYQPDFVVEGKIVIELKALPFLGEPPKKQARYYLRGSDYRLAILVNFGAANLEIERIIYDSIRDNQRLNPHESADSGYILNLIDTPGHSDFSYEVSRALAAVEGAILLVDATQGIQAQTLANFQSAKKAGLKIIGAVNKIDLNPPLLDEVVKSTAELIGVTEKDIFKVSGKTGQGVEELLKAVIEKVPPPKIPITNLFRALIFDSFYHEHKGIVAAVRVFDGEVESNQSARLVAVDAEFKIKELGCFAPELKTTPKLENGQIGYIATGLKDPEALKIGDTIINADARGLSTRINADKSIRENQRFDQRESANLALPGYKEPQPVVFVSFYPEDSNDYEDLKNALGKLKLNDSALKFEPDFNEFLGRGFKGGFLGRLHFEITAERLEKEFLIKTVHSFPSVSYKVKIRNNNWETINNPKDFPAEYLEVMEPIAKVEILTPTEYLSSVLGLRKNFRLRDVSTQTIGNTLLITASLSLADLIRDFDERLKSASSGYASLNYEITDYQKTEVSKLEVLVAGQKVSGLTRIIHKEDVEREARKTAEKLRELLPRQLFAQSVQVIANGRIIAREDIPALKKDVTGYLYGGDRTRKMKLWKKQKRGKERLKERGAKSKINIPAKVFKELLKK